jgi:hypothetical protein
MSQRGVIYANIERISAMNLLDLTVNQLKRAAAVKEKIEALNNELRGVLDGSQNSGAASSKKHTMSASVKRKIAATQRARWAKLRGAKGATRSAKPAPKKKSMSPARRAKLSAKLKAYWAAKKKAGKK